ncbi:MAG: hypothetical protein R3E58_01295 [Phycisphaerae bacterium]
MTTHRNTPESTPPDAFDVWLKHVGRYIVRPVAELLKKTCFTVCASIRNQIRRGKSIQHRRNLAQKHRFRKINMGPARKSAR